MYKKGNRNKKSGFTVVELIIVIAVIALLIAVLIPTFSAVIKNSHHSNDVRVVNSMNKTLAIEFVADTDTVEYSDVARVLNNNNIKVPAKPDSEGYIYYWMPSVNKVVLYNNTENTVEYPKTYKDAENDGSWVDMTLGAEDERETSSTSSTTSSVPEETTDTSSTTSTTSSETSEVSEISEIPGLTEEEKKAAQEKFGDRSFPEVWQEFLEWLFGLRNKNK